MGKIIGKIFEQPAVETAPQMLRCELCGKGYKTEKGLADHMKKDHPLDILQSEGSGDNPSGDDLSGDDTTEE